MGLSGDQAAKAAGADYFLDQSGAAVTLPLNTVLRREYDVNRIRYEEALKLAKYQAYLARVAVEQRIGSRLNTITTSVGPLEPPQQWADDICTLHGVDYKKLSEFIAPDDAGGGTTPKKDQAIIAEFADAFIGDYVAKLAGFVEAYNIQYPSHDADDIAVLSLKDDLLGQGGSCIADSPNLLYHSGSLTTSDVVTEASQTSVRGWRVLPCTQLDDKCLRVLPGSALPDHPSPPAGGVAAGVSWLRESAITVASADGGAAVGGGAGGAVGGNASASDGGNLSLPANPNRSRSVSQKVHLNQGAYVLSWWDQARTSDGKIQGATPVTYQAAVVDETGLQVTGSTVDPWVSSQDAASGAWSPRRVLEFSVPSAGDYYVVFRSSLDGPSTGSLALANVQLEATTSPGAGAGPYIGTGASREYTSTSCTSRTAADVQAAFQHGCDSDGCYYELTSPILIDTSLLASGKSRLNGKLATGNFNFRHINVALNLVGTGVRGCGQDPTRSCYGSGYLEYSLAHDAFDLAMSSWNGELQSFNFGSASINHGKALTAERYITLPIGTSDHQMLAQPAIQKAELRGRPLDGSYRLRIWETPGLAWDRLEDVQMILTYRYWSAIKPQPSSN